MLGLEDHPMMGGILGSATKTPDLEGIKKDQEWWMD
jgi:hypothetical protein